MHLCWQLTQAIDVDGLAISTPGNRAIARIKPRHKPWAGAVDWIDIALLVGADRNHRLSVRRNGEKTRIHPFRSEGARRAAVNVLQVKLHALTGSIAGKHKSFSVRQPMRDAVVDLITCDRFRLTCARGQEKELHRRFRQAGKYPFFVGGKGDSIA